MPAALSFPIGNRFYDWKYESEPEPHMNGRRIYHARGKVLGGSSSINGMIFQRGNPLDYERWAADPGMAGWDYAHCLPYFKRMETCLAGGRRVWRGTATGRSSSSAARRAARCSSAFFEAVQQAGYPLTDDVNGYRQEGFAAFDRNIHRGRRLSAARAYLHPVMDRAEPRGAHRAIVTRVLFEGTRAVGVEVGRARQRCERIDAGEVILCGGAINSPQLLQLSGVGNADELEALGIDAGRTTCPASARTSRTTSRCTSSTRSKQPVSVAPGAEVAQPPEGRGCSGCCCAAGPGATNHFEAAASSAATTTSPTRT
jgi:choline dehydrogenase